MNREIIASSTLLDPYHNISGMHDGIIRDGRSAVIRKVKNMTESELNHFVGPRESDISEINWYMAQTGIPMGELEYQFDGEPVLTQPVKYSHSRYTRDISAVRQARIYAKELLDKGIGFSGESYSHIDRLDILANVAPFSDECDMEEEIVKLQIKAGYPIKSKYEKIKKKKRALTMREELYPYRFSGKIFTPDVKYNNMSLNENIKAAAAYSLPERIAGSAWETISHLSTPINSKFLHVRSPREAYEREMLYGREMKLWDHPIDHFMDAYARGFMSKTTPFQGSIAGMIAGSAVGGPGFGTAVGGAMGAIYGGIHGVFRSITGTTYIPGVIKEARTMNRYFDQLTYAKNMLLYQATGDERFQEEANATMVGLIPSDMSRKSWGYTYRATPPQERPYIMAFLKETDPEERNAILKLVPGELGEVLTAKWNRIDGITANAVKSAAMTDALPAPNWVGYSPEIPLEDIEVKVLEQKGMEAKDFGLGFAQQMNKINDSPWLDRVVTDMAPARSNARELLTQQNIPEMRRSISSILSSHGIRNASVSVTPGMQNVLDILVL